MTSNKSHPTILLLHGALGTSADLKSLKEILEGNGYKTLSFDFAGHGKTAAPTTEFRIDFFARNLEDFLAKHQLKNTVVFGYSMGGYVALYHQINYAPSAISSIITYGTKFNWSEKTVQKEVPMLNPEHLISKFPAHAEALESKHGENWKALMRSTAHMMQNLEKLDGLNREDFLDLELPVLLLLGDQDRMVTSEETSLTASWIPHCKTKVITNSKHDLERANIKEIAHSIMEEVGQV